MTREATLTAAYIFQKLFYDEVVNTHKDNDELRKLLLSIVFNFSGSNLYLEEEQEALRDKLRVLHSSHPDYKAIQQLHERVLKLIENSDIDMSGYSKNELTAAELQLFIIEVEKIIRKLPEVADIRTDQKIPSDIPSYVNFLKNIKLTSGQTITLDISILNKKRKQLSNFDFAAPTVTNRQEQQQARPESQRNFKEKDLIEATDITALPPEKLFFFLKSCVKPIIIDKKFSVNTAKEILDFLLLTEHEALRELTWKIYPHTKIQYKLTALKQHFPNHNLPVTVEELEDFLIENALRSLIAHEVEFAKNLELQHSFALAQKHVLEQRIVKAKAQIQDTKAKALEEVQQTIAATKILAKEQEAAIQEQEPLKAQLSEQLEKNKVRLDLLKKEQTTNQYNLKTSQAGYAKGESDLKTQLKAKIELITTQINQLKAQLPETVNGNQLQLLRKKAEENRSTLGQRQAAMTELETKNQGLEQEFENNRIRIAELKTNKSANAKKAAHLKTQLFNLEKPPEEIKPQAEPIKNTTVTVSKVAHITTPTTAIELTQDDKIRVAKLGFVLKNIAMEIPQIIESMSSNHITEHDAKKIHLALTLKDFDTSFDFIFQDLNPAEIDKFLLNAAELFKGQRQKNIFNNLRMVVKVRHNSPYEVIGVPNSDQIIIKYANDDSPATQAKIEEIRGESSQHQAVEIDKKRSERFKKLNVYLEILRMRHPTDIFLKLHAAKNELEDHILTQSQVYRFYGDKIKFDYILADLTGEERLQFIRDAKQEYNPKTTDVFDKDMLFANLEELAKITDSQSLTAYVDSKNLSQVVFKFEDNIKLARMPKTPYKLEGQGLDSEKAFQLINTTPVQSNQKKKNKKK